MNPYYAQVADRAAHRCEYCHAPELVSCWESDCDLFGDEQSDPVGGKATLDSFEPLSITPTFIPHPSSLIPHPSFLILQL